MARLILIEIADNAEADRFIAALKGDNVLRGVEVPPADADQAYPEYKWDNLEGAKVEAVWAKPTQFCTCEDYKGVSAPSKTYRWMVHAKCAKPHPRAMQHPKDLTRDGWKPQEIPYYLGFRSDGKGWVYRKEIQ
jgi:hypothetical protein